MGLRGDFRKLDTLVVKLERLAKGGALDAMKKNLAAEALTQLRLGFRGSKDPYGNPWKPLKRRKGKPLDDTGRLRGSFTATPTSTGFRIGSNVTYAAPHQTGSLKWPGRPPQRQMLPSSDKGLGPIWRSALREAAATTSRKLFRR